MELLALLAVFALLAAVAWPALANTKPRGQRVACVSNLSRIGQAVHSWAADAGGEPLWLMRIQADGSSYPPFLNHTWGQFQMLSNELRTARILFCPSDPGKRSALDFSSNPDGLLNPANRNNAVSYLIGLHSFLEDPKAVLGADRDLQMSGLSTCSVTQIELVHAINAASVPNTRWTNLLHPGSGNVLRCDGVVEQTSSARVQHILAIPDDNGAHHFLVP